MTSESVYDEKYPENSGTRLTSNIVHLLTHKSAFSQRLCGQKGSQASRPTPASATPAAAQASEQPCSGIDTNYFLPSLVVVEHNVNPGPQSLSGSRQIIGRPTHRRRQPRACFRSHRTHFPTARSCPRPCYPTKEHGSQSSALGAQGHDPNGRKTTP